MHTASDTLGIAFIKHRKHAQIHERRLCVVAKGVVFLLAQSKYGTNVAKLHDAFKGAYKWLAEKFDE